MRNRQISNDWLVVSAKGSAEAHTPASDWNAGGKPSSFSPSCSPSEVPFFGPAAPSPRDPSRLIHAVPVSPLTDYDEDLFEPEQPFQPFDPGMPRTNTASTSSRGRGGSAIPVEEKTVAPEASSASTTTVLPVRLHQHHPDDASTTFTNASLPSSLAYRALSILPKDWETYPTVSLSSRELVEKCSCTSSSSSMTGTSSSSQINNADDDDDDDDDERNTQCSSSYVTSHYSSSSSSFSDSEAREVGQEEEASGVDVARTCTTQLDAT